MTDALVSVVLTNHDYGHLLEQAIQSVLAQTYRAVELVVVDDGSTDGSGAVLDRYASQARVLRQPNRGQAAALDAGVAACGGDILCFLDADDIWQPTKIARVAATLAAQPRAAWLRHPLEVVDDRLAPLGTRVPRIHRTRLHRLEPRLVAERILTASMSGFVLRRELAERVFPLVGGALPATEQDFPLPGGAPPATGQDFPLPGRALPAVGRDFRLDADALLLARCARERPWGCSLAEPLGMYRRHGRQTFARPEDMKRLLERQIEVGTALAGILGLREPSTNFKHLAVLAHLEGGSGAWQGRAAAFLRGAAATLPLASRPRSLARQLGALTYAAGAPASWLRRLRAEQALPD
ncbi:MAG: glycosyltransferase family 2 protein [Gemmatimonadota bacterium]